LLKAAENDETEIVQLLLGAGADANARNRDAKTALSLAQTEEAKQYLIAYGANR
jgi:ankyrin repeat protein